MQLFTLMPRTDTQYTHSCSPITTPTELPHPSKSYPGLHKATTSTAHLSGLVVGQIHLLTQLLLQLRPQLFLLLAQFLQGLLLQQTRRQHTNMKYATSLSASLFSYVI